MRKRQILAIALASTAGLAASVTWLYRTSIVTSYVDDALAVRDVRASYQIEQIGLGTQRLRNLVIGDPANPDLTIESLEVSVALGITGPRIAAVSAEGVRLRGRWQDGRLSFGEVDRLIPKDDGTPFSLPDMVLTLRRAGARIDTPWGRIGVGASGHGRLSDGFSGRIALQSSRLVSGQCAFDRVQGALQLRIANGSPKLVGPLGASEMSCSGGKLRLSDLRLGVDADASPTFEQFGLRSRVRTALMVAAPVTITALNGSLNLTGQSTGELRAKWDLRGLRPNSGWSLADDIIVTGSGVRNLDGSANADGSLRIGGVRITNSLANDVSDLRRSGGATPLAPLLERLGTAILAAGAGASTSAQYRLSANPGEPALVAIGNLRLDSRSGAFIHIAGENILTMRSDGQRQLTIDGSFGGGGLPRGQLALRSNRSDFATIRGELRLQPYGDQLANLSLTPIRFSASPQTGVRFSTAARLSGPLGDGRIDGLTLALNGMVNPAGNTSLSGACQTIGWDRIVTGSLTLNSGRLPVCGQSGQVLVSFGSNGLGGAARIGAIALSGRAGDSPLEIKADSAAVDFRAMELQLERVNLALGASDSITRLLIGRLQGGATTTGYAGTMRDASGIIANVPFLFNDIGGNWQWQGNELTLAAALGISDAAQDARFQPLHSNDTRISYRSGAVQVHGSLLEPVTRTRVADVTIGHDISAGRGQAEFTVAGIDFQRGRVQPVTLSRLSLGVIAVATGTVQGSGRVDWSPSGVTSGGQFSTSALDFAATFGPVRGLSGTITFSDLIGLQTAPGQQVRLASVNPGIEVVDGVVHYQLLADRRVFIEEGRWPLAGGQLLLRPTTLDFGIERSRHLTFDVTGIDAGLFLARYEFDNINASGVFDGSVPTIFDQEGGRIEGGLLTSRQGGTLAYVGELSNRDLGFFANMAFGALKSIKYDRLTISMNGRIDGEMLTSVNFSGLAQGRGVEDNFLTRAIRRLPVIFQINITAPFRNLLTSARGLYDPTILIEQNLPALIRLEREMAQEAARRAEAERAPVQPVDSDDD